MKERFCGSYFGSLAPKDIDELRERTFDLLLGRVCEGERRGVLQVKKERHIHTRIQRERERESCLPPPHPELPISSAYNEPM
jgi:hypothetical protein